MKFEQALIMASKFFNLMVELCDKRCVRVDFGEDFTNMEAFLRYCRLFGVNPNGGHTPDGKGQIFYV